MGNILKFKSWALIVGAVLGLPLVVLADIPVTQSDVDKAAVNNFVENPGDRLPLYAVFNLHALPVGNAEHTPSWVEVSASTSLDLTFRPIFGRGSSTPFSGSLQYVLYTPPTVKGQTVPVQVLSPVLTSAFAFNWDTTLHPDGTYVLGVQYLDGVNLDQMRVRLLQVVINNTPGAVLGPQVVPVTPFQYDDNIQQAWSQPDWVQYQGDRPVSRSHPYGDINDNEIIIPSENGSLDLIQETEQTLTGKWFIESLTEANGGLYEGSGQFGRTADGHIITENYYVQWGNTSEVSLTDVETEAQFDGPRGEGTVSVYSVFVPIPGAATGYYGVDIAGRVFRVDKDGTVTTLAGYRINSDAEVVPYDRREHNITLATRRAGQATLVGTFTGGFFTKATDVTVDPFNPKILYVSDGDNHRIAQLDFTADPAGPWATTNPNPTVTTWAGVYGSPGHNDGAKATAQFYDPYGIDMDSAGNMYVADRKNHAIRKITPAGVVSTVAGGPNGPTTYLSPSTEIGGTANQAVRDGLAANLPFATASIPWPQVVRVDSQDNVIIGEDWTRAVRRMNFTSGNVELIGWMPDSHWGTWIWIDVDVFGTIGPVDDILVAISESLGTDWRNPGVEHSNEEVYRFSQTGAYAPHQAAHAGGYPAISIIYSGYSGKVLETMTHYPWVANVDDTEARFIATGFGSGGVYSLRAYRAGTDPIAYNNNRFEEGQSIWMGGSVWNFPYNIRPSFSTLSGWRGFNRFGDSVLGFDDMALLAENVTPLHPDSSPDARAFADNQDIADFVRVGLDGYVNRPEMTGQDLASLIYFIRKMSVEGEKRDIDLAAIETDLQTAGLHNLSDTTGPVISNVQASNPATGSIQLTWTTDEPAIGVVAYGPELVYGLASEVEAVFTQSHSVTVTDLLEAGISSGTYHFSIYQKDLAGNTVKTSDFTVSALPVSPPETGTILGIIQ